MSSNVKGITIEFRGDTTQLSKALSTIKKEGKDTNRALGQVNNALKYNPGNLTLLTQKQQLLRTRVMETTEKVRLLKEQQKIMAADPSVDKKSADYQNLQREIIVAESQQKRFAREMVKFGNAKFQKVGDGLQRVGKKLTNITAKARMAAGAIAGIALYKGFERLKTLDEVSTSLEKLGYQGEKLEQIMLDTKSAVSGTRFTLTDMAKVAQGALGSGVEDKYKLDEYLGRVSDLAQVGGISVTDMGAMMNKALSKGTVDAKLLNQMNANGIPIYTLLAESIGVTSEEIQDMCRQGEISFDDLYKATDKYKGLAEEMGTNTFSGAVTVLGQQFGLMGASFLEGAYEPIKEGVKGIVKWLKKLQENGTIKQWGEAVGETIRYFVTYFKDGETSTEGLSSKAQKLVGVLSPMVKIVGAVVKGFMALPAPLKGAIAMFALFGGPVLSLIGGFTKMAGMISGFAKLAKTLGGVGKAIGTLVGANPVILAIVAAIAALVAIGVVVYKHWDEIKKKLTEIWNAIKDVATNVWNGIKNFFTKIWNGIETAVLTVWNGIKTYFVTIFNVYKTIFTTAFNAIKKIVTTIFGAVKTVITNIAAGIKNTFSNVFTAVKDTASRIWNGIKTAIVAPIEKAKDLIKKIIDKIKGFFSFKVSLPHIKLPHFAIKPKGWKLDDLLKGSIPKLGIDWYAKGGIFKSPSVIGVGEKGPEAVLPIEKLQVMMSGMADSIVNGVATVMQMQNVGAGAGEITIPIYLYPSGPKMGEETVKAYDTYKKILG